MNLSDLGSGGVKSVQRGVSTVGASATLNVTVSAVNMSKSVLLVDKHQIIGGGSTASTGGTTSSLSSSTNIQIINNSAAGAILVAWQLIEYR